MASKKKPVSTVTPERTVAAQTRPHPPVNQVSNPGGRDWHQNKLLAEFSPKSLTLRHKTTRDTWIDTAYLLAVRAKSVAKRSGKLDYNLLYRLVLSAGIAMDKAFPKLETPASGTILHLYNHLGAGTVNAILQPAVPTITVTPSPLYPPSPQIPTVEHVEALVEEAPVGPGDPDGIAP